MATIKIFQHFMELSLRRLHAELDNAADDLIGARLIACIQISWFCCRSEGSHDNSAWVRKQAQALPV